MPLGDGYFYDLRKRKLVEITEHATDAVTYPKRFRAEAVKDLNPVKDRDRIVIHVCQQGFIRIREYRGRLGWQFYGHIDGSLSVLKKYIRDREVGDYAVITFTDFESGKQIEANPSHFLSAEAHSVWSMSESE